jgi:hypothetical protein
VYSFIDNIYKFNDIPKRKDYIFDRLKKIYNTSSGDEINKILDCIKIKFREQCERGASNHKTKIIYVPLKDVKRFKLKNKQDVIDYLENPKSVIMHEIMHIFQNIAKSFPHVQYLEQQFDGKYKINYEKYVNDSGEKQARLEQVLELLNWGFTKQEIIQFIYNRTHNDKKMWNEMIDSALNLKKDNNF